MFYVLNFGVICYLEYQTMSMSDRWEVVEISMARQTFYPHSFSKRFVLP